MAIINSILDTDLYKLTMGQVVEQNYGLGNLKVEYRFIDRNNLKYPKKFIVELKKEIENISKLRLTQEEYTYLQSLNLFSQKYIEYMMDYRFNPSDIRINIKNGKLDIKIKNRWRNAIYWEVPLLAVISELYYRLYDNSQKVDIKYNLYSGIEKKESILKNNKNLKVVEFGTRRRYSYDIQNEVIDLLKDNLAGTSNVHFAMKHGIPVKGTYAHEAIMAMQYGYDDWVLDTNSAWMDIWIETYQGKLGIALTDTIGTDRFLQVFNGYYARIFDGVRVDSGDPHIIGDKIIKHYQSLGINPKYKSILFSNNLAIGKNGRGLDNIEDIYRYFKNKTNVSFGIGTSLTNDVGVDPLNIVIKLNKVEDQYVVKLSDDVGKYTGHSSKIIKEFIENLD